MAVRRKRESINSLISEMRQLFWRTTMKRLFPQVGNSILGDGIKNSMTITRPDRMGPFAGLDVCKVAHKISHIIQDGCLPSSATLIHIQFTKDKSSIGRDGRSSRRPVCYLYRCSSIDGYLPETKSAGPDRGVDDRISIRCKRRLLFPGSIRREAR